MTWNIEEKNCNKKRGTGTNFIPHKSIAMAFKNVISWFEIPATDLDRAQKFYEAIFGVQLIPMDMVQVKMRMFPVEDPMTGISGAIIKAEGFYKPSATDGPLVYLNANPDVQLVLDKIEANGGKIAVPKTQISPEHGYMAVFIDTEGNRIALHSIPPQA
jgi:predicted enzyme related to lactoylglutathione lyase